MSRIYRTDKPTGGLGSAFPHAGLQPMDKEQERFWLLRRGLDFPTFFRRSKR